MTTMKVSGISRYFVEIHSVNELIEAINWSEEHSLPYQILAGGSNIIFACKNYNGLVIKMNINSQTVNGNSIEATAGTPINILLQTAKENSLSGLEAFSGLPGTVGGAVRGNAGCYGKETSEVLSEITILNENLEIEEISPTNMDFQYRSSRIKNSKEIVLSATYKLTPSDKDSISNEYSNILHKRISQQAKGFSSGSFFKNPKPGEIFAGSLIEKAELKNHKEGGMVVSDHHANYLINTGSATCNDLLKIKDYITKTVDDKFSVLLEPEVTIITN